MLVMPRASLTDGRAQYRERFYVEAAVFVIAGRVMWAVLQWMGRLYVLTDLRILRLSGVFTIDVFDCPLRKVRSVQLVATVRERLLGLASIEIHSSRGGEPSALWQTISRPKEIHAKVLAAINRAKQTGFGGE